MLYKQLVDELTVCCNLADGRYVGKACYLVYYTVPLFLQLDSCCHNCDI